MSVAQAALLSTRPSLLGPRLQANFLREIKKGCGGDVAASPVALEPPYTFIGDELITSIETPVGSALPCAPRERRDLVRLQVWVSPEQKCDWVRSERFLKQLQRIRHRVGFEIVGNRSQIELLLSCDASDLPVVQAAFYGEFERCELTLDEDATLANLANDAWDQLRFEDYLPHPPYSHLFTRPEELRTSPYAPLMAALASISPPAVGLYQVLLQPVARDHDWHHNVQRLVDMEFYYRLIPSPQAALRYMQQVPSGDLRQMAIGSELKAHPDKPFFVAALRAAIVGVSDRADELLYALGTFSGLIQHGGRPLASLGEQDYLSRLTTPDLKRMFLHGYAYRPGFVLNSGELASLVHIPPAIITEHRRSRIRTLEPLLPTQPLVEGVPIGVCQHADREEAVCVPLRLHLHHMHVIGETGCGKTNALLHMVLHYVKQGHGTAVIDPHGDLVKDVLKLIPPEHVDRVIYFNPGDPKWVPIWNPLRCGAGLPPGRVADDLVGAFRRFITGWGDRLAHLLRYAILGVLHLPDGNLLDVANLLRQKSDESEELRARILALVDQPVVRSFWQKDFDGYRNTDLTPPQHKLSKLLTEGTVARMLSQSETSFEFRDIMDTGKILLVDLSDVGSEVREVLGCFVLSLLHLAAVSRSSARPETRRPFHIFCDEAHRFMTDAIEDLIAETRKFNVSLTLAHHYMSQFDRRENDAVSSVGSTVIFSVNSRDADYLKKDLQSRVRIKDLNRLPRFEAIARLGTEIVRIRTLPPPTVLAQDPSDGIIARSRARYCRPSADVDRDIRRRVQRRSELVSAAGGVEGTAQASSGSLVAAAAEHEPTYDEL